MIVSLYFVKLEDRYRRHRLAGGVGTFTSVFVRQGDPETMHTNVSFLVAFKLKLLRELLFNIGEAGSSRLITSDTLSTDPRVQDDFLTELAKLTIHENFELLNLAKPPDIRGHYHLFGKIEELLGQKPDIDVITYALFPDVLSGVTPATDAVQKRVDIARDFGREERANMLVKFKEFRNEPIEKIAAHFTQLRMRENRRLTQEAIRGGRTALQCLECPDTPSPEPPVPPVYQWRNTYAAQPPSGKEEEEEEGRLSRRSSIERLRRNLFADTSSDTSSDNVLVRRRQVTFAPGTTSGARRALFIV